MTTFKDRFGNEWDCKIDMATAARINRWDFSQVYPRPVSLYTPDEQLLKDLALNAGLVVAFVYAICKPRIDERYKDVTDTISDGVNPREMAFLRGIDGAAIEDAKTALFEALADFFPPRKTSILNALRRPRAAEAEMEAEIQAREPELNALLKKKGTEYIDRLVTKLQNTDVETLIASGGSLS